MPGKTIGEMTPSEFTTLLEEHGHQCLFGGIIAPEDARRVVDVIEEWGDGNFREGVEIMRENGRWVKKKRESEQGNKDTIHTSALR